MTELQRSVIQAAYKKRCFSSADWKTFRLVSDQQMQKIFMNVNNDDLNSSVCNAIQEAANQSRKKIRAKRRLYPREQRNVIKQLRAEIKLLRY